MRLFRPSVLVDLERLRHPFSGLGYYCLCLGQGLNEIVNKKAERIDYYGASPRVAGACIRGFRPWHRLLNPTSLGYDVLHITHQLQRYFVLPIPPRCGTIVTLHDLNFLHERRTPWQRFRAVRRVGQLLARADVVVCISEFVRQDLLANRSLFKLKPHVRIEVIHNGIMFAEAPAACPTSLTHLSQTRYLLCIGVLLHKKQQHLLVDMLAHLDSNLHLVLVYSEERDPYAAQVREAIARLGLTHRVHLLSEVSDEEKQYLLAHCTAYVHPSIAEGFGIPPIEAMYFGRPTFVSRATSLPEVCGEEAYYFGDTAPEAMAETLQAGLADYAAQIDKADRLRAWAKRYDYRRMASEYYQLYQELLGKH